MTEDHTGVEAAGRMERLEARVPADIKALFSRAAALRGQSLTDFVLSATLRAANRVVREQEILRLTWEDQELFARGIIDPPAPGAELKRAARWYRRQAGR
jgi:uncharacterized protein (DUF1778 family)